MAYLQVELHLPAAQNLKQKRSVIKSLKDKLARRFNISVAEVGHLDKWQRASLALVMVANDTQYLTSQFEKIRQFIDDELAGSAYVISKDFELL